MLTILSIFFLFAEMDQTRKGTLCGLLLTVLNFSLVTLPVLGSMGLISSPRKRQGTKENQQNGTLNFWAVTDLGKIHQTKLFMMSKYFFFP
jgi:hypothetical protein